MYFLRVLSLGSFIDSRTGDIGNSCFIPGTLTHEVSHAIMAGVHVRWQWNLSPKLRETKSNGSAATNNQIPGKPFYYGAAPFLLALHCSCGILRCFKYLFSNYYMFVLIGYVVSLKLGILMFSSKRHGRRAWIVADYRNYQNWYSICWCATSGESKSL